MAILYTDSTLTNSTMVEKQPYYVLNQGSPVYNFFWNLPYLIKNISFFRYTVSAETGYVAEVSYEGTPVYPPAPEPKKPLTE